MTTFEKIYSLFAVLFAIIFFTILLATDLLGNLTVLIVSISLAFMINIAFMFILFKDLYFRKLSSPGKKAAWFAAILIFWPAAIFYLAVHGFKQRQIDNRG